MLALSGILKLAGGPLERRMLFQPTTYPDGNWEPQGLTVTDVHFSASDGTPLHGWFCRHPNPRAAVLWCHGNAGNLTYRAPVIQRWLSKLGVDVFVFDYRGYGRSVGRPCENGLYDDARAAYEWLCRQASPKRIFLLGRSLGGAVAMQLALEKPHKGLILESTFTSIPDMARTMFRVPLGWFVRNRFDTLGKLARYEAPLLIVHGTNDAVVPFSMGRRLFESAAEPKQFFPIPDADHDDTHIVGGRDYFKVISDFLDRALSTVN